MNGAHKSLHGISVIMPVYNCEKYVSEAIESILGQTFTDFEFIIIDDGSTDRSFEIIKKYGDNRITAIKNKNNLGNYPCRNAGMAMARGEYICVMDADDISEPRRFKVQYQFMEDDPATGICGTFIRNIPSNIIPRFITGSEQLKVAFLSNNFCSHPSLMMRKEFMDKFNLRYNEDYYYSADFDLCARALKFFKIVNIPEVLVQYRRHSGQISSARLFEQQKYADMIRINQLIDFLDFKLEEIPVLLHLKIMKRYLIQVRYKVQAEKWVKKILEKNERINYYNQEILSQFLFSILKLSFRDTSLERKWQER